MEEASPKRPSAHVFTEPSSDRPAVDLLSRELRSSRRVSPTRVQVAFRMEKPDYRELKRMALEQDITVNELLIRAVKSLKALVSDGD